MATKQKAVIVALPKENKDCGVGGAIIAVARLKIEWIVPSLLVVAAETAVAEVAMKTAPATPADSSSLPRVRPQQNRMDWVVAPAAAVDGVGGLQSAPAVATDANIAQDPPAPVPLPTCSLR